MLRLSGEELSKLYPQAKTYDEIKSESALIQEARRPKFVSLKIALWAALIVPVVLSVYLIVLRLISSIEPGAITGALFGVCFAILAGVVGLAIVYYLYSLIDGITAKVFADTTPLYIALTLSLCLSGALVAFLNSRNLYIATLYILPTALTFMVTFTSSQFLNRYN